MHKHTNTRANTHENIHISIIDVNKTVPCRVSITERETGRVIQFRYDSLFNATDANTADAIQMQVKKH